MQRFTFLLAVVLGVLLGGVGAARGEVGDLGGLGGLGGLEGLGDPGEVHVRISGVVLLDDGAPAVGATVTLLSFGGEGRVGRDGSFVIETRLPGEGLELSLVATRNRGGDGHDGQQVGTATGLVAGVDGVVDAGVVVMGSGCSPGWIDGLLGSQGMNATVNALVVFDDGSGPALYAGGGFTQACGIAANRVARWDGERWWPVGTGMNNTVRTLKVYDDGSGPALYAGGDFTQASGTAANRIARWNGSLWTAVGGGMNSGVWTLAAFDDGSGPALYAGGPFTQAGGVDASHIARWDGVSWSSLGEGQELGFGSSASTIVMALAVFDDGNGPALYAGGHFIFGVDGTAMSYHIARWDGTGWSALGDSGGIQGSVVRALAVFDDGGGPALYVGGSFSNVYVSVPDEPGWLLIPIPRIARWDGVEWSSVGEGTNGLITTLTVYDDGHGPALYAGGAFSEAGGNPVNRVARWDGTEWSSLGDGIPVTGATVTALAWFDGGSGSALYAGGNFNAAVSPIPFNRIARWDGVSWAGIGGGLNGQVDAFAVFDDGSGPALYAGGRFTKAGGVDANYIARWDGLSWSPLGDGNEMSWPNQPSMGGVRALAVFDDGNGPALYVGGRFLIPNDGFTLNCFARWDGTEWSAHDYSWGIYGILPVEALAVFDDGSGPALYVGGSFFSIWAVPEGAEPFEWILISARRIIRWDGIEWSLLGSGIGAGAGVHALTVFDDGNGPALYAGGGFAEAGGNPANRIARWDGTEWSSLGDGIEFGVVRALAVFDDGSGPALYAGGSFTTNNTPFNRIARWDGTEWSAVGGGVNNEVHALKVFDNGSGPALYVGGEFTQVGEIVAARIARWTGTHWSTFAAIDATVRAFEVFTDGSRSSLFVGGDFEALLGTAGQPLHLERFAELRGCAVPVEPCVGDLNGDGVVDADDLGVLLGAFGQSDGGDLNGDGVTDADDLGILLGAFGNVCE